jgi:hypothetical protein
VLNHGFRQYDVVKVTDRLKAKGARGDWRANKRVPSVGDVGTIVEVLTKPGLDDCYVVECVAPDGTTIWLANFAANELSPAAS